MRQVLTNFTLFVDGRGYAGKIKELELPKVTPVTVDYLGGGMAGTIKVPMGLVEPLEMSFTLMAYDLTVLTHFGVVMGAFMPLTARGAITLETGEVVPVMILMRGQLTEFDPGTWTPGEESNIKISLALGYYRLEQGGVPIAEFDLENSVHTINGIDQLALTRAALGI